MVVTSDLAKLYQCNNGTKPINQAVKRYINRFPERFMFQLSKDEYNLILRSQLGTLELEQGKYSKYLPYVFTEQGVAMLSAILRTKVAEEVSIKITDIFKEAKEELIIIDAYADKTTLDMIKELNVSVTLIVKEKARLKKLDITKYQEQYDNLKVIYDNTFHDRYFILDKDAVYHCGTSINNAGSKTFSINKIEDSFLIKSLLEKNYLNYKENILK